jgi:hypothetical protein
METTKYRRRSYDGIFAFLEYQVEKKFLFFKWKAWKNIAYPNQDRARGYWGCDFAMLVSTYTWDNLDSFVKRYPNINDYYENYFYPQMEKYNERLSEHRERIEKETSLKYY